MPNAKIVFNAPYDDKRTYHIKVSTSSLSLSSFLVLPHFYLAFPLSTAAGIIFIPLPPPVFRSSTRADDASAGRSRRPTRDDSEWTRRVECSTPRNPC